jgi:hypothetical protein
VTAKPPSDEISAELSSRRIGISFQRTRMSADRTLLSVMRTSVSPIGFGFATFQFLPKAARRWHAHARLGAPQFLRHAGLPWDPESHEWGYADRKFLVQKMWAPTAAQPFIGAHLKRLAEPERRHARPAQGPRSGGEDGGRQDDEQLSGTFSLCRSAFACRQASVYRPRHCAEPEIFLRPRIQAEFLDRNARSGPRIGITLNRSDNI